MPIKDKVCTRCGKTGLCWANIGGEQFKLHDSQGIHTCPPVTTASTVARTKPPTVSPVVVRDAVLDMVAKVAESFNRTIDTKGQELFAEQQVRLLQEVDRAYNEAVDTFRNLMPIRHDLYITAPNHTDVIPDTKPHFQLQRMVDWLNIREHVWAAGPAGSGKSTAAKMAASVLGLPAYSLSCGPATDEYSILGYKNPLTGEYTTGHMRQPYEHGGVFILDELDNTQPSVLTTINGALDSQDCYQFPDVLVPKHPNFIVVGCANTLGTGPDRQYMRNQIDAATLDRFVNIPWMYDEDAEYDWAGRDQTQWVDYVQNVRQHANELSMRVVISPRASIRGAKGLRNGLTWDTVAHANLWTKMGDDDRMRLQSLVGVR